MSPSCKVSPDGRWLEVVVDSVEDIPPGLPGNPRGTWSSYDIGRYTVTFMCVKRKDGELVVATEWQPYPPKKLRPRHLKEYRRRRLEWSGFVAKAYGVDLQVIDRMDGAPVVTALCYSEGDIERLDPPIPYVEPVRH